MNKKWVILGISLLVIILYWTRYQVVETHTGDSAGFYKINRITGQITWIEYEGAITVE